MFFEFSNIKLCSSSQINFVQTNFMYLAIIQTISNKTKTHNFKFLCFEVWKCYCHCIALSFGFKKEAKYSVLICWVRLIKAHYCMEAWNFLPLRGSAEYEVWDIKCEGDGMQMSLIHFTFTFFHFSLSLFSLSLFYFNFITFFIALFTSPRHCRIWSMRY